MKTMNLKRIFALYGLILFTAASGTMAQPQLSLSLEQCRAMALEHSEELQQADLSVRRAELDNQIATTAYLPKIEGTATGAYVLPDIDMMGMDLRMRGTYLAGITLTQPIYTGGKITSGKRLARIGEEAAAQQLRMTRMDVLVEADNAYWSYLAVRRKIRVLESYASQMESLYQQTRTALDAGLAIENDLLRIEAKRSEVQYQLQKVRNGADLCRLSLCRLIGTDYQTEIEQTDTTVTVTLSAESLNAGIDNRPELQLLRQQIDASRQQLRMVEGRSAADGRSLGGLHLLWEHQTQQHDRRGQRHDAPLHAGVPRRNRGSHAGRQGADLPLGRKPQEGTESPLAKCVMQSLSSIRTSS